MKVIQRTMNNTLSHRKNAAANVEQSKGGESEQPVPSVGTARCVCTGLGLERCLAPLWTIVYHSLRKIAVRGEEKRIASQEKIDAGRKKLVAAIRESAVELILIR